MFYVCLIDIIHDNIWNWKGTTVTVTYTANTLKENFNMHSKPRIAMGKKEL